MRVFIYESSSFGGCYEYGRYLFKAYKNKSDTSVMFLPVDTEIEGAGLCKVLLSDKKRFTSTFLNRIYFLFRQFVNPFILFFKLLGKKASLVVLNDFEQISAPIWAPMYRLFLRRHVFAVVLHDPDRDNYPPFKWLSTLCMKHMMQVMDLGLYHESLPRKTYYANNRTRYLKVPHGLFDIVKPDEALSAWLSTQREGYKTMTIVGNIRYEKNYDMAIEALASLKDWKLVIAGAPANSGVSTGEFKSKAAMLGVEERIVWIERFLTDEEMASVIRDTNLILLNYKRSFASQSGILNLIAPYEKDVLISDTGSGMSALAKKFKIGQVVAPENLEMLVYAVRLSAEKRKTWTWAEYKKYASWNNHVDIVINSLRK